MLLGAQGVKLPLLFRAVGIKIRGFGGISDEALPKRASPKASFFSGVPGFFRTSERNGVHIVSLANHIVNTLCTSL